MHTFKQSWDYIIHKFVSTSIRGELIPPTYRWWHFATILSGLLGIPSTLLFLALALYSPISDSMGENIAIISLPLIFAIPICFIYTYITIYRQNRHFEEVVNKTFGGIVPNGDIRRNDSDFTFNKDGFCFTIRYTERPIQYATKRGGRLHTKERKTLYVLTYFNAPLESILEEIYEYKIGKPISDYFQIGHHLIAVNILLKDLTPQIATGIIDEMIYITQRFNLTPITAEQYRQLAAGIESKEERGNL